MKLLQHYMPGGKVESKEQFKTLARKVAHANPDRTYTNERGTSESQSQGG